VRLHVEIESAPQLLITQKTQERIANKDVENGSMVVTAEGPKIAEV
jgi:hypothetical protein